MNHPVSTPLIINLPAYPTQDITNVDSYLPSFLHQYPTATIHYRWSRGRDSECFSGQAQPPFDDLQGDTVRSIPTPLQWPTPISDTLAAYDFLRKTLSPASDGGTALQRRDVYVHGSYLGASLAASLALTETYVHEPMAIRGLSAYNGIYNWTTFLPDHPINRLLLADEMMGVDNFHDRTEEGVAYLRDLMPTLFGSPAHMFDPFASPVLFFHTSGLMIPPSFTERYTPPQLSAGFLGAVDALSKGRQNSVEDIDPYDYVYSDPEDPPPPAPYPDDETEAGMEEDMSTEIDEKSSLSGESSSSSPSPSSSLVAAATTTSTSTTQPASPRKGYLAFPPRWSTLNIPDALLIHSSSPPLPKISNIVVGQRRRLALWKKLKNAQNSFGTQALGLGSLMRRSVNKLELRERMRWDDDFDWDGEAAKRVRIEDTGDDAGGGGLSEGGRAEKIAAQWFEERMF